MAKRRAPRSRLSGLDEYQISHKLYDAVADVLKRHPAVCLDHVMERHRLAYAIARGLHGRFPEKRRGIRRLLP